MNDNVKKGLIIGGVILVVMGIGLALMQQDVKDDALKVTQDENLEPKGDSYESQGSEHIAVGAAHAPYNSNPPTSGPHYVTPAEWGVYQEKLPDEQLVHNLEHGGIWISYKDIDADTKSKLETIANANRGSVIVTPRPENDAPIAVASWTRLMKLQSYDEQKILEFIAANKNKSPEPLAQ